MKKFKIEEGVFDIFPNLEIGVVVLRGIDNTGEGKDELLAELCEKTRQDFADLGADHPCICDYREAMKTIKKKKGAAASIDSMTKRIMKGINLNSINQAVDLYNLVSLEHLFTCGGENLDKIAGDIRLGFAKGTEHFVALGDTENSPPREGELIYYDDAGAIVRSWLWREAERTKITAFCRNIILYLENINPDRHEAFTKAIDALTDSALAELGGGAVVNILSREQPEIVIG